MRNINILSSYRPNPAYSKNIVETLRIYSTVFMDYLLVIISLLMICHAAIADDDQEYAISKLKKPLLLKGDVSFGIEAAKTGVVSYVPMGDATIRIHGHAGLLPRAGLYPTM